MANTGLTPLERAVIAVFEPLVRLVLKRGIPVQQLADLLKYAYVNVVRADYTVPNRKLSISRIAVLTGLTRREASRLVADLDKPGSESPRRQFNRAARVLTAWIENPQYHDARGRPRTLSFEDPNGVDFSHLVKKHGADVPPRAVLDELLRVGAVRETRDGRFRLVARAYIPQIDEEAGLAILGADVADLISAIDHNLTPDSNEKFFQRKVAYDNLPPDYLPRLRRLVGKDAQKLLERLNRDMSKRDRDVQGTSSEASGAERHRAMIGIYYFEEETDEAE